MLVYRRVYKVVKQIRFLFQFFFHQTTMYRGFITSSLFCSLQFANHFNHLLTSFFHTIHKSISRSIRNTFIKVAPQIHTRPNVVIRCPHEKTSSFSFRLGHAPQSSPISLDPLLALRQMIAAVEWCLAKEERNAGGVSSMAWSCVQAEMGQKRLAEDGWALLRMHPLDERCPLSHNFTMFYLFFGGYEVVTPGGDGKEIANWLGSFGIWWQVAKLEPWENCLEVQLHLMTGKRWYAAAVAAADDDDCFQSTIPKSLALR